MLVIVFPFAARAFYCGDATTLPGGANETYFSSICNAKGYYSYVSSGSGDTICSPQGPSSGTSMWNAGGCVRVCFSAAACSSQCSCGANATGESYRWYYTGVTSCALFSGVRGNCDSGQGYGINDFNAASYACNVDNCTCDAGFRRISNNQSCQSCLSTATCSTAWQTCSSGQCGDSIHVFTQTLVRNCTSFVDEASCVPTYACMSGYYGTAGTTSPSTCTVCPAVVTSPSSAYGTSDPGTNFYMTQCFTNGNYNDNTGTFNYPTKCNYSP